MILRFGRFELDPDESSLRLDGERVEIQPKVLDALALFVENSGRLLTKEDLLTRLWPGVIVSEESLTQVVRKLRVVLGDDPQQPRFLETVPKRGYRFLPAVVRLEPPSALPPAAEPAPPAVDPTPLAPAPPPAAQRPARRRAAPGRLAAPWLAGAALVLLVLGLTAMRRAARPEAGAERGWRDRRLTVTPEREHFPAISPDGRRFAFVRAVGPPRSSDLFVAALDGGVTRLTASDVEEFAPQFSPDGQSLVYTVRAGERGSVWSVPALGGPPSLLVEDAEWGTWAPDGRRVAFVRREPGQRTAVLALELETGEIARLWGQDTPLGAASWSPDGAYVAAIGGNRAWIGAADGSGAVRAVGPEFEYVRSVAWEPDARALIVDGRLPGQGGNLTRLPLDGTPPTALTRGSTELFHPSLSRDGRSLLYAAEHKVRQIWRLDADRRPVAALSLPTALECFDVAPDGASLAATDWSPASGGSTLALFALDGGQPRALGDGLCPAFAPGGERLAFLGYEAASRGLWVLDLATGERRRVAEDRGELGLPEANAARRPAWSPDSRRIAYEGVGLAEGSGVFVVDLASGRRRLVAPGVFGNLSWSADGRHLAASGAGPESGFAVIDVERGAVRRVGHQGAYRASAFFRADGRVVFLADQTTRPALIAFDPDTLSAEAPAAVELPIDASFWGLFELVPDRRGGYLATVERYESDLYLAERAPR